MPPPKNVFRIRDLDFRIADATLGAQVPARGAIEWSLDVVAKERAYLGEDWKPHVYVQRFPSRAKSVDEFLRSGITIKDAKKFIGRSHVLPGGRLSCLYVFEHTFMNDVKATLERKTKSRFVLRMKARASVNWNRQYGKGLPLVIEGPVQFLGLGVDAGTKTDAFELLAGRFDVVGLRYHKVRGESGCYFVP